MFSDEDLTSHLLKEEEDHRDEIGKNTNLIFRNNLWAASAWVPCRHKTKIRKKDCGSTDS